MALTLTLADPEIFDPYSSLADPIQSNRLRAYVKIEIGSGSYFMDVTSKVDPHLVMVRILTGAHIEDYQCEIELDDRDGSLPIPPIESPLNISLGWVGENLHLVWEGVIHDIEHGFGRKQGGRRMWIHGLGAEMLGGGKEPQNNHWGEGAKDGQESGIKLPVSTALKAAAKEANHEIEVHPDFDKTELQKDWYQQAGESYYHFAKRLADEYGAVFRVKAGNKGQFTKQGQNIDGTPTPNVMAVWGKNLIGWRVRPVSTRQMWAQTSGHFFDVGKSMWDQVKSAVTASTPFNFASAGFQRAQPAANQEQASGQNQGDDDGIGQQQGQGRIVINGEPTAQGNCIVQLSGARPGVDGSYWAQTIEHIYSRQGYVTWCDVQAVQLTDAELAYLHFKPPLPPPRPPEAPQAPPAVPPNLQQGV
jgi:hypothetical protein